MDLSCLQIPNFVEDDRTNWEVRLGHWLKRKGLAHIFVDRVEAHLYDVPAIASFWSDRKIPHAVVIVGKKVVWDPSGRNENFAGKIPDSVMYFLVRDPSTRPK